MGKKERLAVHLMIVAVPESVKEERLARLSVQYKTFKKGKDRKSPELSPLKKILCGYNLLISNAPESLLNWENMVYCYGMRWQIEIFFKIWKSLFQIDEVKKMDGHRFHCYLYGRLIALLLCSSLTSILKNEIALAGREVQTVALSDWKVMKYLKKN